MLSEICPHRTNGWCWQCVQELQKANDEKDQQIAQLKQWINDLQRGSCVTCMFCGKNFGPEEEAVNMADVITSHVESCPNHPLSRVKDNIDDLLAVCEMAANDITQFAHSQLEQAAKLRNAVEEKKS